MTEWEPATEPEAALREALLANDQQRYFRILARTDLFLPVAEPALTGQAATGWGTWTTGGRTHVLAFTSATAMRACLGEHAGASRRTAYGELAGQWPNHEWWLAVNPGLPIEGYLPAWYVAQLARGDVRLPGRTMGARARLERPETLARVRGPGDGDTEPAAGLQGRVPSAGAAPQGTSPPRPVSEPAPPPGTPLRTPAEVRAAALRRPLTEPGRTSVPAAAGDTGGLWPSPARGADRPGRFPADVSANSPSDGEADRPPRRSFFEPASGRVNREDRAVPPPRFARGGQPFPRRRPLTAPVPDAPTRAFPAGEETPTAPAHQDTPTRAFATPGDTSQAPQRRAPLQTSQRRAAGEEARTIRLPVPDPATLEAYARRAPDQESRQTLPRRRPTPPPPEPEPASIAEPVSGSPAPRRGFTPIVIEGTIIETRDLIAPPGDPHRARATGLRDDPGVTQPPQGPAVVKGERAADAWAPTRPDAGRPGLTRHPVDARLALDPQRPVSEVTGGTQDRTIPVAEVSDPAHVPGAAAGASAAAGSARPAAAPADADPVGAAPDPAIPEGFEPANEVEEDLLEATGSGSTDTFLSTLLLARVLLPVAPDSTADSRPGEPGFVWRTDELDGETFVVVYTSPERLAEHTDAPVDTVRVRFLQLIQRWPDESWSFAVNPGTPVGAKLPGEQIVGLANWAAEVGLGAEPEAPPAEEAPAERPGDKPPAPDPSRPVVMQKAVAPSQLAYYLERGYDRVSGFVHRAGELAHLTTPEQLYDALGLGYPDSPFDRAADEIYVLRWPAYRPSLYRIPYGGQNETAMRAMEGWIIERPPFRGNGFAPGDSSDVVAEFKVDSARLPHGAQLWRLGADGTERVVAALDADELLWREAGDG
ncbi:SseB family protein [Micromonospora sp. WMMA1363]|uniref:SseB family protein n=1 Tax=Micromonospora sp. WMMA1363 TaxID=3053985 RepID=UPI00259D2778|nr:SseB family protein [Micromonospora sp. WMMA1363]MDM4722107.1 SseB family protein [Micromonospora sp. WMMA1363]